MIFLPDVHPDDLQARVNLRDHLARLGAESGLSGAGLGERLHITRGSVNDLLRTTSWAVRRVQAWARALDHELRLTITGVEVPDTDDLYAEVFASVTPQGPADADRLHLRTVVNDLMRAREHAGVTYRELGRRAGVDDRSLRIWEHRPDACLVKSVQRYTRALGGALRLDLTPVNVGVPA